MVRGKVVRGGRGGWSAVLGCCLVLAALLAACGGGKDDDEPAELGDVEVEAEGPVQTGGELRIARGSETSGWDPTFDQWVGNAYTVANAIFDPLMAYDQEDVPRPFLAASVESNDDFTLWTIELREGVTFQNGEPLDADALVKNFQAHKASPVTGTVFRHLVRMEATDPLTVELEMDAPWSTFPHALAVQPGYIAAPEMLENPDRASEPIGTGPFELREWTSGSNLIVDRNDDYWQEGFPLLDTIEFPVIEDWTSRANSLASGDADVATFGPESAAVVLDLNEDAQAGELQLYTDDSGETSETFVILNAGRPPFDDPIAREALIRAIDRESVSRVMFEGIAPAANGIFKPDSPYYAENGFPEYDPDRARELVQQYEDETGEQLKFDAVIPPGSDVLGVAEMVKEQAELVGMEGELITLEATQHIVRTLTGDFQASAFRIPFYQHPDMLYPFFHSSGIAGIGSLGLNVTMLPNEEIDAALDEARTTDDLETQIELYQTVDREMAEDMTRIWIVHDVESIAARNEVRSLVDWELPGGTPGQGQSGVTFRVHQIWLDQD